MKVLVTRAEPAASTTADALREARHEPVLMPLSELADTGAALPDEEVDGFIFTSANAPRVLKTRGWRNSNPEMPAFCVGRKTAFAALQLGFQKVTYADGGGEALAHEIDHHHGGLSKLLYLTTPDRQFDMQAALQPHGIEVEIHEIYRMQTLEIAESDAQKALHSVADGAILVYSTESGKMLLDVIKQNSMIEFLQKTSIITISAVAAKPFEQAGFQNINISEVPNEISMFHILDKLDQ